MSLNLFDNLGACANDFGAQVNGQHLGCVTLILQNAINILLFVVGFTAVIFAIVGGIRLISSSGNPEGVKAAKRTIGVSIGGLLISMLAATIINFIIDTLGK